MYHNLLAGESHYKPWDVHRLTIPQLLCIAHKKPPGEATLANASDFQAYLLERADAEKAWGESP